MLTISETIKEIREESLVLADGSSAWDEENIKGLPYMLGEHVRITITPVSEYSEPKKNHKSVSFVRRIDSVNPYGFKTIPYTEKKFWEIDLFYDLTGAIHSPQLKNHPLETGDAVLIEIELI